MRWFAMAGRPGIRPGPGCATTGRGSLAARAGLREVALASNSDSDSGWDHCQCERRLQVQPARPGAFRGAGSESGPGGRAAAGGPAALATRTCIASHFAREFTVIISHVNSQLYFCTWIQSYIFLRTGPAQPWRAPHLNYRATWSDIAPICPVCSLHNISYHELNVGWIFFPKIWNYFLSILSGSDFIDHRVKPIT